MLTKEEKLKQIKERLQQIREGISTLQKRIKEEGVTSPEGEVIIPPGEYIPREIPETPGYIPTEGDIRLNPRTGKYELYNPFGEWQEITPQDVLFQLRYGGRLIEGTPMPDVTQGGEGDKEEEESETGDPILDELLEVMRAQLDELRKRGQMINPDVEITPDKVAEFLAQAEREISPYYATQLKLARDTLLSELGYTKEDILRKEQEYERLYGKKLRTIGEEMAEKGFALSGPRIREERELADVTQRLLEEERRTAQRAAEQAARGYAQLWGGEQLPTVTLPEVPTVTAGVAQFQRAQRELPIYQLKPSVYEDLVGEKQWEEKAEKRRRAAELEEAFRTKEEARLRKLQL